MRVSKEKHEQLCFRTCAFPGCFKVGKSKGKGKARAVLCRKHHGEKYGVIESGSFRRSDRRRGFCGVSKEQYASLFEIQKGCCAICGEVEKGKRLCVDHDHKTGRVRGLLCHGCNFMLGHAKDCPERLRNGLKYILGGF
jgi:Recombination endonuclease VII